MRRLRTFKKALIEDLKDPGYAQTYLSVALEQYEEDKNMAAFLTALRDVAEAKGGLQKLSEKTDLNRQNLYKVQSPEGKPGFSTIESIVHGLGYKFVIERMEEKQVS